MPTTLPKRRPIRRDRRLELVLLGLVAVEFIAMSAAMASTGTEGIGMPAWLTATLLVTCTTAEVPCSMLAP